MPQDKTGFSDNREIHRRRDEERRKEQRINLEDESPQDDRREGEERRFWPFGLIYNTPHTAKTIEDWMEENCSGDWDINIEGIDTERKLKSFKIRFDNEEDKQAFVNHFTR